MDIPQRIETIIQRRKQQLPEIEAAIQRIKQAREVVDGLDAFKDQLNKESSEFTEGLLSQLATVSTAEFYREYERSLTQLNRLHARFSREEVNISFVGRAGQGKSLVLQRISGLDGDVIPSSGGAMDCTGARSIISNRPGVETFAEITFFSEQEFLGIINKYLLNLFRGDAGQVTSVNAVNNLDKKRLQELVASDPVKSERMKHLSAYIDHAKDLKDKLGTHISVPKAEIERYVAQYNSKDPSIRYYDYLIVKEARIFAPFPYAGCGKIVLVDTIGTGATSLGVEEEMLRTVREDSDAIILMMRPEALRGRPGIEHYELLEQIINEVSPEYTEKMLFWLINRVEEGPSCNASSVPVIISALQQDKRPVAGYLNVNCWDKGDVENSLLAPVLEQMSAHLDEIDQTIIDRTNTMLADIENAYHKISSGMERAAVASISEDVRREFRNSKIANDDGIIGRLFYSLQRLFLKYEAQMDLDCEPLKQAAGVRLKNILRALPSEEEILKIRRTGQSPQAIIMRLADMLRIQIVNDFLGLNEPLSKLVLDMKRNIVHCLADKEYGNLALVISADPEDPAEWLTALRNSLDPNEFPMICRALQPLEDFELRMENFLIYKVRRCLTPIDWFELAQTPQLQGGIRDEDVLVGDIQFQLQNNLEIIYRNIREELENYYSFPNTAMYAVVRDFSDRASCAYNASGKSVKVEWQDLYENSIRQLWPEECKTYYEQKEHSDRWNDLCDKVQTCAAAGYFKINRKDAF